MTVEPGEELLTAREVGIYLGMSTSWVLKKHRANVLPGIRLPGSNRLRWRRSAVEALLQETGRPPLRGV